MTNQKTTDTVLLAEAVHSLLMLPEYRVVSRSTVHSRLRDAFEHLERIHALCSFEELTQEEAEVSHQPSKPAP